MEEEGEEERGRRNRKKEVNNPEANRKQPIGCSKIFNLVLWIV